MLKSEVHVDKCAPSQKAEQGQWGALVLEDSGGRGGRFSA